MLQTLVIFLLVTIHQLVLGYDVDADLARGLIHNDSAIIRLVMPGESFLSGYPEDCAAIYSDAKARLSKQLISGMYEIWPRQGIDVSSLDTT